MKPAAVSRRPLAPQVMVWALLLLAFGGAYVVTAAAAANDDDAEAAWVRVLETFVDTRGRIDFAGLERSSADLEYYVRWLANHGPRSTPAFHGTRDAALAFHLNAYNALAMHTVLRAGPSGTLDAWRRIKIFMLTPLRVDGAWTTLYFYENRVIRPLGEPRVHFALNCMVRDCPRLPRLPFRADMLEVQLSAAARAFVGDPHMLVLDPRRRVVAMSSIFSFYTKDFLTLDKSLIAYVNRLREGHDPLPADYTVEFLPYDWTVNRLDSE